MSRTGILSIFLFVVLVSSRETSYEEEDKGYYNEGSDASEEQSLSYDSGEDYYDGSASREGPHHQGGRGFWDVVKDVGKKALHEAKNADYKKMAKDNYQAGKDAKEFYDNA